MIEFNPNSPKQLSALFFGGNLKEKKDIIYIKGLGLKPLDKWKTKTGSFQTNEEVLKLIAKKEDTTAGKIASLLLKSRKLNKEINTYYEGVKQFINEKGFVHPQFSHCGYGDGQGGTETGRLSCYKPNVQQIPKNFASKVKQHFVSRFEDGVLIECDFSQLEIVVQAELSKDDRYRQDVINGIDFHCKRLAFKEGLTYEQVIKNCNNENTKEVWKQKRSQIKEFSFQRAYGAGAKSISENTGIPYNSVMTIIEKEKVEYPTLNLYNQNLIALVNKQGYYNNLFGRRFYFKKYEWKGEMTYKPTDIQNYMIQGTATADISMIMFGIFWRETIKYRNKFLIINTVHDSIVLDCKKEYIEFANNLLKKILEKVPEMVYNYFGKHWSMPVKVDIKSGSSWWDC